jgi:hypothetical protein
MDLLIAMKQVFSEPVGGSPPPTRIQVDKTTQFIEELSQPLYIKKTPVPSPNNPFFRKISDAYPRRSSTPSSKRATTSSPLLNENRENNQQDEDELHKELDDRCSFSDGGVLNAPSPQRPPSPLLMSGSPDRLSFTEGFLLTETSHPPASPLNLLCDSSSQNHSIRLKLTESSPPLHMLPASYAIPYAFLAADASSVSSSIGLPIQVPPENLKLSLVSMEEAELARQLIVATIVLLPCLPCYPLFLKIVNNLPKERKKRL